jgi:hypothetical protein
MLKEFLVSICNKRATVSLKKQVAGTKEAAISYFSSQGFLCKASPSHTHLQQGRMDDQKEEKEKNFQV